MAAVLDGFEDFNRRVRMPLGFRIRQPARERVFLTESGRAEFWASPLPDVVPPAGKLMLSTVRSHDQWNTTIYSDNDRYRGVKNLRTLLFMNRADMAERGLDGVRPDRHHQLRPRRQHPHRVGLSGDRLRHPGRAASAVTCRS